jgi:hypothetical protein
LHRTFDISNWHRTWLPRSYRDLNRVASVLKWDAVTFELFFMNRSRQNIQDWVHGLAWNLKRMKTLRRVMRNLKEIHELLREMQSRFQVWTETEIFRKQKNCVENLLRFSAGSWLEGFRKRIFTKLEKIFENLEEIFEKTHHQVILNFSVKTTKKFLKLH